MKRKLFFYALVSMVSIQCSHAKKSEILVVGHRGSSFDFPEHTLEGYQKAIDDGADLIEPDVVMTKDKHLIARHENEISTTTDVALVFPERKKTKTVDGEKLEGYFTEDFTLEEIKKLKAVQRLAGRDQGLNGKYSIPTLAEVIDLVLASNAKTGKQVGLIPEVKHSTYHQSVGLDIDSKLLEVLNAKIPKDMQKNVWIQSFEVTNLKKFRKESPYRTVQLIEEDLKKEPADYVKDEISESYEDMMTADGVKRMASYVDVISPAKSTFFKAADSIDFAPKRSWLLKARELKIKIIPYTFRSESEYVFKKFKGNALKELKAAQAAGVSGVFADYPKEAKEAFRR